MADVFSRLKLQVETDLSKVNFDKIGNEVEGLQGKLKNLNKGFAEAADAARAVGNLVEAKMVKGGANYAAASTVGGRIRGGQDLSAEGVELDLVNKRAESIRRLAYSERVLTDILKSKIAVYNRAKEQDLSRLGMQRQLTRAKLEGQGHDENTARQLEGLIHKENRLREKQQARINNKEYLQALGRENYIRRGALKVGLDESYIQDRLYAQRLRDKGISEDRIKKTIAERKENRELIAAERERVAGLERIKKSDQSLDFLNQKNALLERAIKNNKSLADTQREIKVLELSHGPQGLPLMNAARQVLAEEKAAANERQLVDREKLTTDQEALNRKSEEAIQLMERKNRILQDAITKNESIATTMERIRTLELTEGKGLDLNQAARQAITEQKLKQSEGQFNAVAQAREELALLKEQNVERRKIVESLKTPWYNRIFGVSDKQRAEARRSNRSLSDVASLTKDGLPQNEAKDLAEQRRLAEDLDKTLEKSNNTRRTQNGLIGKATGLLKGMAAQLGHILFYSVVLGAAYGIFNFFKRTISAGFEYLNMLEQVQLGTAATVSATTQLFDTISGQELDPANSIVRSMALADEAIRIFQADAIKLGVDLQTLIALFPVIAGSATAVNVPLEKQVTITEQLVLLGQKLGLTQSQLKRTVDNIFRGQNVQRSELGAILQLSTEMINGWKRAGTFVEEFTKRLEGVNEVLSLNVTTFEGLKNSIKATLRETLGSLFARSFETAKLSLERIRQSLILFFNDTERVQEISKAIDGAAIATFQVMETIVTKMPRMLEIMASLVQLLADISNFHLDNQVVRYSVDPIGGIQNQLNIARESGASPDPFGLERDFRSIFGLGDSKSGSSGGFNLEEAVRNAAIESVNRLFPESSEGVSTSDALGDFNLALREARAAVAKLNVFDRILADELTSLIFERVGAESRYISRGNELDEEMKALIEAHNGLREATYKLEDAYGEVRAALLDFAFNGVNNLRDLAQFRAESETTNMLAVAKTNLDRAELTRTRDNPEGDQAAIAAARREVNNLELSLLALKGEALSNEKAKILQGKVVDQEQLTALEKQRRVAQETLDVATNQLEQYRDKNGKSINRVESAKLNKEIAEARAKIAKIDAESVALQSKTQQADFELGKKNIETANVQAEIDNTRNQQQVKEDEERQKIAERSENQIDASNKRLVSILNKKITTGDRTIELEAELQNATISLANLRLKIAEDLEIEKRKVQNRFDAGKARVQTGYANLLGSPRDVADSRWNEDSVAIEGLNIDLDAVNNKIAQAERNLPTIFNNLKKNSDLIKKSYEDEESIRARIVKNQADAEQKQNDINAIENKRRDWERENHTLTEASAQAQSDIKFLELERLDVNNSITTAIEEQRLAYLELRSVIVDVGGILSDSFIDVLDTGNLQETLKSAGKKVGTSFIQPFIKETFDQKIGKFDAGMKKNLLGFIPGLGKEGGEETGNNLVKGMTDKLGITSPTASGGNSNTGIGAIQKWFDSSDSLGLSQGADFVGPPGRGLSIPETATNVGNLAGGTVTQAGGLTTAVDAFGNKFVGTDLSGVTTAASGTGGAGGGAAGALGGLATAGILTAVMATINGAMAAYDKYKELNNSISFDNILTDKDYAKQGTEAAFKGFFDTVGLGAVGGALGKTIGGIKGANASTALIDGILGGPFSLIANALGANIDFGIMQAPTKESQFGRAIDKIFKKANLSRGFTKIGSRGANKGPNIGIQARAPSPEIQAIFESLGFESALLDDGRYNAAARYVPEPNIFDNIAMPGQVDKVYEMVKKGPKALQSWLVENKLVPSGSDIKKYAEDFIEAAKSGNPEDIIKLAHEKIKQFRPDNVLKKGLKTVKNVLDDFHTSIFGDSKARSQRRRSRLLDLIAGEKSDRLNELRFREALGIGAVLTEKPAEDAAKVANQLIGNYAQLDFSSEETRLQLQQFAQEAGIELPSALRKLATDFREGQLTIDSYRHSVGAVINLLDLVPQSIDGTEIAAASEGLTGILEQGKMQRIIQVVQGGVDAIRSGMQQALQTGDLYSVSIGLAEGFADSFMSTLFDEMVNKSALGAIFQEASTTAALAIDKFVAGDLQGGRALLDTSRQQFLTGQRDFIEFSAEFMPYLNGYLASLGIPSGGPLINPSGSGYPQFNTTGTITVPGSQGMPLPAVVHGGEIIRNPGHEDRIVTGINALSQAVSAMRQAPTVNVSVFLNSKEIAKEVQVSLDKGNFGINLPKASLGA